MAIKLVRTIIRFKIDKKRGYRIIMEILKIKVSLDNKKHVQSWESSFKAFQNPFKLYWKYVKREFIKRKIIVGCKGNSWEGPKFIKIR